MPTTTESDYLLPLVLGVTGHRNLRPEDRPAIESAVANLIRTLQRALPNTPKILLSPLASGADQLVADVFLNTKQPTDKLLAPLPFAATDYRNDFTTENDKATFDRLLADSAIVDVPTQTPEDDRPEAYERVGALVAGTCHILIALWDGTDSEQQGGTSQIIRYRLTGVPRRFALGADSLTPEESGPVFHIWTPRDNQDPSGENDEKPGATRILLPETWPTTPDTAENLARSFSGLEQINRRALDQLRNEPESVARSRNYLTGPIANDLLTKDEERLSRLYSVTDSIAVDLQRWMHGSIAVLLVVGLLFVLLDELYEYFFETIPWGLAYASVLVLGMVLLKLAQRSGWHGDQLSCRAIAEGLRVQFFWRIAGVNLSVAESYLRLQHEELQTIRQAIRGAELSTSSREPAEDPAGTLHRVKLVLDRWVVDQRNYFVGPDGRSGTLAKTEASLRRFDRVREIGGAIGVAFLLVPPVWQAVTTWFHWRHMQPLDDTTRDLLFMMGAMALSLAAAVSTYVEVLGLNEHARSARKMGEFYARAEKQLRTVLAAPARDDAYTAAQAILADIGRESLAENAEWLILHRDHPIDFDPA